LNEIDIKLIACLAIEYGDLVEEFKAYRRSNKGKFSLSVMSEGGDELFWVKVERESKLIAPHLAPIGCQLTDLINDESNNSIVEGTPYKSRWAAMVGEIETVQTQATQLWFKEEMPKGDTWVSGTYAAPNQGQVDFSDLIPVEAWPEDGPKGIFNICGAKMDTGFPPFSETDFPKSQYDLVRQASINYLNMYSGPVLPEATVNDRFDFDCLFNPVNDEADPEAAFNFQYWRANIDPSERYVTALPGASKYRLNAWGSGHTNLSLSGDSINTGLNVDSMEGTVMGGNLAAYAVSGSPAIDKIYGFDPFGLGFD
jgi:uncharacterized protein with NAD-binding domain and iron-sulfur cluster